MKYVKKCGSKDVKKEYISHVMNKASDEPNRFYLCPRCSHIYDVNVEIWLDEKW